MKNYKSNRKCLVGLLKSKYERTVDKGDKGEVNNSYRPSLDPFEGVKFCSVISSLKSECRMEEKKT